MVRNLSASLQMSWMLCLTLTSCMLQSSPNSGVTLAKRNDGNTYSLGSLRIIFDYELVEGAWRNGTEWSREQLPGRNSFFKSVAISYKGTPIQVPRSAFLDLADIYLVKLEGKPENAQLKLSGGNDGWSYVATFKIVQGQIVKREVRQTVFSGEFNEVTTYVRKPLPTGD